MNMRKPRDPNKPRSPAARGPGRYRVLSKTQVIATLSERTQVPRDYVLYLLHEYAKLIVEQIGERGVFQMPEMGRIQLRVRQPLKEAIVRNPHTLELVTIPAKPVRRVVVCRLSRDYQAECLRAVAARKPPEPPK